MVIRKSVINISPGDGDLAGVYYLVNIDQPFPDACSL